MSPFDTLLDVLSERLAEDPEFTGCGVQCDADHPCGDCAKKAADEAQEEAAAAYHSRNY